MHRRFLPISILTGVLFIVALAGYLLPTGSDAMPVRILLENKGGKVIFEHQAHADMPDRVCADCHHTSGNAPEPPACSSCHATRFDEVFVIEHQDTLDQSQCISCHHQGATIDNFSHDDHADDYAAGDCQSCHHDASIEPEPQSCGNCHGTKQDIPSLKDANHARCASCHEDLFEQGASGCSTCHTRKPRTPQSDQAETTRVQPCSDCHQEPADQLVPTTAAAFHKQCMGCHEDMTSGPYGDDACYKCHMK